MVLKTLVVSSLFLSLFACSSLPKSRDALPPLPSNAVIKQMAEAAYKNGNYFAYHDITIDSVKPRKVFPEGFDYVACLTFHGWAEPMVRGKNGVAVPGPRQPSKRVRTMMFRHYGADGWIAPLFKRPGEKIGGLDADTLCPPS